MSIINSLGRMTGVNRQQETPRHVALKEIYCNRRGGNFIKQFRTPAVGTAFHNPDGSDRQEALRKLKAGDRVRLIWEEGEGKKKEKVHLLRMSRGKELNMPDCFGRLDDKTAADVVRWMNSDNIATMAKVVSITGADTKRRKLGCVLELTTYRKTKKGRWLFRLFGKR